MAFLGEIVFVVVYDLDRDVRAAASEAEPHQTEVSAASPPGDRTVVEADDAAADEEAGYGHGV